MPYATYEGTQIHYRVEGSGPALILQHGFFWSLDGWERWGYVGALEPHFRLVLVDARGHGGSDKPYDPAAYSLSHHAADIIAVLDALGIPSAHYWGFSMGGWIGFGLATFAPERLRALVIGGAHPYGRKLSASNRPDGSNPELFLETFFQRQGLERGTMEPAKLEEFVNNDFRALAAAQQDRPSLEETLPRITKPVLLYVGEDDGAFPEVTRCAGQLPDASLVSLPGLNHPETFHRADLVLPHVMPFLKLQPNQ